MTCDKSERELWVESKRIGWHLNHATADEDRDRMVARWHAARAEWKVHLSEPIGIKLAKNSSGGFEVLTTDSGIGFYRVSGDIRSEAVLAATASQIWNGERPRRDDDPDAQAACEAARTGGLPQLVDELRRQRDELG